MTRKSLTRSSVVFILVAAGLLCPARAAESKDGVQITRLGSRVYRDTLVKKVDPRGRDYYWIGGEDPVWEAQPGTDFHAVSEGRISVTPLRLDLTDEGALVDLRSWRLEK